MKKARSTIATFTAVLAALYAIGVVVVAPFSFQVFQARIADALLPLSILFGWPAIIGLAMGALVANVFGGLGPVDVVGGSVANFVAGYVAWSVTKNRDRRWIPLAIGLEIIMVTLIVGTYLSYILALPLEIGWFGIMLGSIITIGLLGSVILYALSTERLVMMLRSCGIPVYARRTGKQNSKTDM